MESKKFRELLVELVKAAGQEVIDRAEDIVGNGDFICDFDIWLRFHTDGRMAIECPTIEVTRGHYVKEAIEVLSESYR